MPIEQWGYVAEPSADGWYPKEIAVTPCGIDHPRGYEWLVVAVQSIGCGAQERPLASAAGPDGVGCPPEPLRRPVL